MVSRNELPPWLEDIEGDAVLELITSDASIIRVVAGPGSGKSTGLKRRVQRLVEGDGVNPDKIFVGTFTRAITKDLYKTLEEHSPYVSTLHSFAFRVLRENRHVLMNRSLRFLLEFERDAMLYDIKPALDGEWNIYQLRDELNSLQATFSKRQTYKDARFSGAIDKWLRHHSGMLIEEVVPMATEALEKRDLPPGQFDHVIVDEYQDLTECEQRLVELIWSGSGSLVILGDDDQSIYGFRYNHPEGVNGFGKKHSELLDIKIPDNWRSGSEIVNIANLMMEEAGSPKPPMYSKRDDDGKVTLLYWESIEGEVEGLSKYILGNPEQEFFVLVPRRFIGYRLRDLIGEDARTEFNQEVLDHPLVQERFTLATLLANPEDRIAFRAWLGFGRNSEQASERNTAAYRSVLNPNASPIEITEAIAAGNVGVKGKGQKNIKHRSKQLLSLLEQVPDKLSEQIDYLFDPDLSSQVDDNEKASRVRNDLKRLRSSFHKIRKEGKNENLRKSIAKIRYRIVTRAPLTEMEEDTRVRIMTLHSAKGLEADVIIIAGAADQMIPGDKKAKERDEQRRLFYVAITRARDHLIISWPKLTTHGDAKSNYIRIDKNSIFRKNSEVWVKLACTSLLPKGVVKPRSGADWLAKTN